MLGTVSLFDSANGVRKTSSPTTETVYQIAEGIRDGRWQAQVEEVRRHPYGSEAYKAAKVALPYFTPHGVFPSRNNASYQAHSGIIQLDFDLKDNPGTDVGQLRDRIAKNPNLAYLFASPSGGVKFGVRVQDLTERSHRGKERAIRAKLESLYQVELDGSQGKLSQPCFVSYDPATIIKPTGPAYQVEEAKEERRTSSGPAGAGGTVQASLPGSPVADRIAAAVQDVGTKTQYQFVPGQRKSYLASLCIYANLRGIAQVELEEWFCENLLPSTGKQFNNYKSQFSPYQRYAEDFGKWAKPDPFTYQVEATEINFGGYIGQDQEAANKLGQFLLERDSVQIQAPTGSGKTRFLVGWLQTVCSVDRPGIIATPTQALADQIGREFELPVIRQGSDKYDFAAADRAAVVVCVVDSLPKLKAWIPGAFLVFDESHHLVSDCKPGFKFEQINKAMQLADQADKVILVSATPCPYVSLLDYEFVQLVQDQTKPLKVQPVYCSSSVEKTVLAALLESEKGKGKHIIFYDEKAVCNRIERQLIAAGRATPDQVAILNADNKGSNPVYHSIIDSGRIPAGIEFVLTTRLIADGVNILNEDIAGIHLANIKNEELFLQFPARFRRLPERLVHSYRPAPKEDKRGNIPSTHEALTEQAKLAEQILQSLNKSQPIEGDDIAAKYKPNDSYQTAFRDNSGEWRISAFALFRQEVNRRDRYTTAPEFYHRISRKYNYVSILEPTYAEEAPAEVEAAIKADKAAKKAAKDALYQAVLETPSIALSAVEQLTTDSRKKDQAEQAQAAAEMAPADPAQVAEFIEENKGIQVFRILEPLIQFARLILLGFTEEAARTFLSYSSNRARTTFKAFERRLWVQAVLSPAHGIALSARDQARRERLLQIRTALKERIGKRFTGSGLRELLNSYGAECSSNRQALQIARELFLIKEVRDRVEEEANPVRMYEIGDQLTLEEVLNPYGMEPEEWLKRAKKAHKGRFVVTC